MTTKWMPGAHHYDLHGSRGNGPFGRFLGVCLHVNVDHHGTPDSFWRNNSGSVTPNFQVYKSPAAGGIHQMLPFDWQPWCQINGNFNYAAIETAGYPDEPFTAYQLEAIAKILRIYHAEMGMRLAVATRPGQRGFITHQAGGAAWGGHACPGPLRANARDDILRLVGSGPPKPHPHGPARLRRSWPSWMPRGHVFGNIARDAHVHGGIDRRERSAVRAIQQRLQALGYAPRGSWWADGVWEQATTDAVAAWHRHHYAADDHRHSIDHDAWLKLFIY